MLFTKKHKTKLEQEILALRSRINDNELVIKEIEGHLGISVLRNWNAPKFIVKKKEEVLSKGQMLGMGSTEFKL